MLLTTLLVPFLVSLPGPPQEAGAAPGRASLAEIPLQGTDGRTLTLGERVGAVPLVLTYTGVGCPISGKYAPRLTRLAETYGARGVRFLGINANPQDASEDVARDAEELGYGFEVVKDVRQRLTRAVGATTTTEVFLFDADGGLRYRGAVDDQYDLGAARPEPRHHFLKQALEAVLAGNEPPESETEAPGCLLTLLPEDELPPTVTWSHDVARIVQENCEVCHRPGQVGPFALQSYEQAKGWAQMIASVVEERRMPPWNAHERFDGTFVNERTLTRSERETLLAWIADGMPRGNPDEDPPAATWAEGWRIGEPDVVFSPKRYFFSDESLPADGFRVPREGVVEYQYFAVDTDYPEDRWVRAMEVRPGAADVVHHVLVGVHDPREGPFRGEEDLLHYLAVAVPGDTPSVYPEGYAKLLPAGATLIFQLHYTPNGKERVDRSSVGFVFADEPPIFEVVSNAILNQRFRIPPGADDFEVRAEHVLGADTGLLAFFPHMHTRGKDFRYVAHYPDGSREELLSTDYDFNWQESYIYPDPLPMPAGTRIECIGHFDNSAANRNNPDPSATVRWGDQTWEEMFVGYYDSVHPLDS